MEVTDPGNLSPEDQEQLIKQLTDMLGQGELQGQLGGQIDAANRQGDHHSLLGGLLGGAAPAVNMAVSANLRGKQNDLLQKVRAKLMAMAGRQPGFSAQSQPGAQSDMGFSAGGGGYT